MRKPTFAHRRLLPIFLWKGEFSLVIFCYCCFSIRYQSHKLKRTATQHFFKGNHNLKRKAPHEIVLIQAIPRPRQRALWAAIYYRDVIFTNSTICRNSSLLLYKSFITSGGPFHRGKTPIQVIHAEQNLTQLLTLQPHHPNWKMR